MFDRHYDKLTFVTDLRVRIRLHLQQRLVLAMPSRNSYNYSCWYYNYNQSDYYCFFHVYESLRNDDCSKQWKHNCCGFWKSFLRCRTLRQSILCL